MRKTLFSAILIFALTSLFLQGCKIGSKKEALSFDSIKVDTICYLDQDTASPHCHVSLSITYAKGENSDYINDSIIRSGILVPDYLSLSDEKITIPQAIDSFINTYVKDYKEDYGQIYQIDKTSHSLNNEYTVKTHVQEQGKNYITYIANVYMFGGGAHGNSIVITKNIDAKTGKIITLNDIFLPNYETDLNQAIEKELLKAYKAKDLDELKSQGFFMGTEPYASDNFIVTNKDITFIYSPDEIAPHAVGEIRVSIKKDDIKSLLKK